MGVELEQARTGVPSLAVARRQAIVTSSGPVDKTDVQVIADALHVLVLPIFKWIRPLRPSTGVTVNLIRWTVDNVYVAAIGLPARPAGCHSKVLVGIRDPPVMFFFEFVCT